MTGARAGALVLTTALAVTACAGEAAEPDDPSPWEEPVAGAVAVTEWEDQGQPAAPFGPGGPAWGSAEELLSTMAQSLAGDWDGRTTGRVVEHRESGTVIGWVRMEDAAGRGPVVAGDLRIEMRNDGGSWVVVATQSRQHCSRELVDGACE